MPVTFVFPRLAGLVLALTLAFCPAGPRPLAAQEPEFFDIPYAPGQWNIGRRLDVSQLRYCVDTRDADWEVAAAIADAVAGALLLEPNRYVVESSIVTEDITRIYAIMLEHCDVHMGFKLIPGGLPNWVTLTRPYYEANYVFVASDPALNALSDVAATRPIAATMGTSAHLRLVSYLTALPRQNRWPTYPMGSNDLSLESVLNGRADIALVWGPSFWAKQRKDPAFAGFHVIDPTPLPPTALGVGALLLSDQTFLRTAVDEAIDALVADGTIQKILDDFGFPAMAGEATAQ